MNKYTNIFKLSFIFYTLIFFSGKYVTAQIWADIVFCLFICSILYQLTYIIYFRKKDNKKILNLIVLYFLYGTTSISIAMIINYIKLFIFGYTPTDWIGNSYGITYYGFSALKEDVWDNIIYLPWLTINVIIIIIYYTIKLVKIGVNRNE